jgi:hypothetical protein
MGIIEWARAQKALAGIQNSESFLHVFRIEHIQLSLLFLFVLLYFYLLSPWERVVCVCATASRYYRFPCLSLLLSTFTISILEGTSSYVCILYMQGRKSEKKMVTLKTIALHGRVLDRK